ncbi:hypothetical protein SDC9_59732 [bioreactor metagenome]|uniref:Uncharacterized protein n=1 Tax=bioreactor metagenome TaxID=1076179 RepID=A0A644XAX3_9ZZZZ
MPTNLGYADKIIIDLNNNGIEWDTELKNGKFALLIITNNQRYIVKNEFDDRFALIKFFNKIVDDFISGINELKVKQVI